MNRHTHLAASLFVFMACGPAYAQDPADDAPMARDISKPGEFSVVHGDLEKGNADVVTTFQAGMTSPHHWHTTAERMVLLSGELHLKYDGHETMVLKPGSYAYGPAKLAHTAACMMEAPCVLFIATELPFDEVIDLAHMDADRDGRVSLTEFQDRYWDFNVLDRNDDQMLSSDELPIVGAEPITRAQFRGGMARLFATHDLNGDGHIEAEELIELARQQADSAPTAD